MGQTDRFRRQHDELLAVANSFSELLTPEKASTEASLIRTLLSELSGKLLVHLAMEDKSLYPRLLDTSDAEFKTVVQDFIDEMGGIAKAFDSYEREWSSGFAISADPERFIEQSTEILEALRGRIERENNHLYDLADKL